jgi:hypothetical protein
MADVVHRVVVPSESVPLIQKQLRDHTNELTHKLISSRDLPIVLQVVDIAELDQLVTGLLDEAEKNVYFRNRASGHITMFHNETAFKSNVWISENDKEPHHLAVTMDSYKVSILHEELFPDLRMFSQMSKLKVSTSTVRIVDKYILAHKSRVDALIRYLNSCFTNSPTVEIILDEDEIIYEVFDYFLEKYDNFRNHIKLYTIVNQSDKSFFHDRFLWCDWYLLKLGRGFDLRRNVSSNSVDGRLLSKSHWTWFTVFNKWDSYLAKCALIDYDTF